MNYYIPSKKQVITRSLMDSMGLPEDDAALAELGYYPLEYRYQDYDALRQGMLPDGDPVARADGKGYVQNFKVVPLDEERLAQNLAKYKGDALERLNAAWLEAEQKGKLASSAGFEIDATDRANRDISGLITMLEQTGKTQASFCGADNQMRPVSLDQLKVMRLEVIQYGQQLYAKKWAKREAIESAASFEAVDAVNVSFAEA